MWASFAGMLVFIRIPFSKLEKLKSFSLLNSIMQFSADCCRGFKDEGTAQGSDHVLPSTGTHYYLAQPQHTTPTQAPAPSVTSHSVLLLTDVFGYTLINSRLYADALAHRLNKSVIVLDMFKGDPLPPDAVDVEKAGDMSIKWYRRVMTKLKDVSAFVPWILRHTPSKAMQVVMQALHEMQQVFSALEQLDLIGFCYGGGMTWKVAEYLYSENQGRLKCGRAVMCHPAFTSIPKHLKPFLEHKVPLFVVFSEHDDMLTKKDYERVVEAGTKVDDKMQVKAAWYEGTSHGFAIRGGRMNPVIKAAREQAFEDVVEFLGHDE
jgi:dienelactone hydrolase